MEPGNNTPTTKSRRAAAPSVAPEFLPLPNWAVKADLPDGRKVWGDANTGEEITLNGSSVPCVALLDALAAQGIVPELPDYSEVVARGQSGDGAEIGDGDEETALSRILTRMKTADPGARIEVKIYREPEDGKSINAKYCGVITVDEYDEHGEEAIRARWGAGRYRVRVYGPGLSDPDGRGKFTRLTNELVEIEPSLVPVKSPLNLGSGSDPTMMAMMQQLIELQRKQHSPESEASGMENLMKTVQVLRSLGIVGGNNNKAPNVVEQLKEMDALIGFGKKHLGGQTEEKEDSMISLAGKVLEVVAGQSNTQPNPVSPAPVASIPPLAIPDSFQSADESQFNAQGENVNLLQTTVFNAYISAIIGAARRGDPVEKHAKGLYAKLPDEALDMMHEEIWFDVLCNMTTPQIAAALNSVRPWLDQMRAEIIRLDEMAEGDGVVLEPEPDTPPNTIPKGTPNDGTLPLPLTKPRKGK